ncbi:MAG: fasciclin domain-containing protein [Bacteroidota bacterium]
MQLHKLSFLSWALIGLMFVGFSACDDDDDNNEPELQTVTQTAVADAQFSTLVTLLERVDLDVTLNNANGTFTVFAPTNQAFQDANIDPTMLNDDELAEILNYHVINGAEIASTDLIEGQTYAPSNALTGPGDNALSLLVERSGTDVTVNGTADVVAADVRATNGVIHAIDDVLMPLDIVGHASANSNLSALVGQVVRQDVPGNIPDVLTNTNPITVFAPLNSAFMDIEDTVNGLMPAQIATVLTYHVITGLNARSEGLSNGQVVPTANVGQSITVNKVGEDVSIEDSTMTPANVELPNIQATNGVIHVLDKVLIPSNL